MLVPSSLVYSAFSGFFLAALHTDPETPSWGQWQASAIPMLVSCGDANDVEAAMRMIEGTARSMGIEIQG